jgi:hypothetical protein
MLKIVIAYESKGDTLPFIPDVYFVQENDNISKITRDGSSTISADDFKRLIDSKKAYSVKHEPVPIGHWLSIESFGIIWFSLVQENTWRATRAKALMDEAAIQRPLEAIQLLSACAGLMRLDIYSLVDELERNRGSPKESLADIFQRIRPAG